MAVPIVLPEEQLYVQTGCTFDTTGIFDTSPSMLVAEPHYYYNPKATYFAAFQCLPATEMQQ